MVLTLVAAVWMLVLAGLPLYVFPGIDPVRKSDVALVLGPPMDVRLSVAERLRDEGLADRIVISVQAANGQTAGDIALCQEAEVTCAVAEPSTTRGEVLLMAERASASAAPDAPSVIVVTSTPHVARTRYWFSKCYPGRSTVVAAGEPATVVEWAYQYVYQSLAFVKAVFQSCAQTAAEH